MPVGLILVSHSAALAAGAAELAGQMAPEVTIAVAGGADDGGIGTSFDKINVAIAAMDAGPAVLLYDLGSAVLTAEMALEFAEPEVSQRIRIVDAPLVEGALAAAVAAQGGGDLDAVTAAAKSAGGSAEAEPAPADPGGSAPAVVGTARLINPLGLHARPAANLLRVLDGASAAVTIGRAGGPAVDLRSVLRVVALALRGGETVEITGHGPDAERAVHAVVDLIATGFGEAGPAGRPAPTAMGAAPARLGNAPAVKVSRAEPTMTDGVLTASPGAPGVALGVAAVLDRAPVRLPAPAVPPEGDQQLLLSTAITAARRNLAGGNQFQVAHAAILADPELADSAGQRLGRDIRDAAGAWWAAVRDRAEELAASPDELVAARAVDVREAGAAVLAELGVQVDRIPAHLQDAIVVTDDLGPGEVPELVNRGCVGVVLARSSVTAHAVIVARGLGLPVVLQAGEALTKVPAGTVLVVDGDTGQVKVDPDPAQLQQIRQQIAELKAEQQQRITAAAAPVVLRDGRSIHVVANIGSLADARAAVASGADGVGLLRTELLLLDRESFPDEDTQTADLSEILEALGDRPVVVRVLDAGGDKPVTALDLDAHTNGFLGVRGLRYLLANPEVLRVQLRAILRAAVGHRVSLMAPMVSVAAEMVSFREQVQEAIAELERAGTPLGRPVGIGAMIEVPAAALAADEICAVCDFVSVGTNDLTGYTMAADRTITEVAGLLDPNATAVQRLLDQLCAQAVAAGVPVAVCGEMAGMVDQVPGLIARGVGELSMAPARIPVIKQQLRGLPG